MEQFGNRRYLELDIGDINVNHDIAVEKNCKVTHGKTVLLKQWFFYGVNCMLVIFI
mgnify:CR=1 FL=1